MNHESPYDQREADWRDEDLRQRRAEEAEEFANEVRQLGGMGLYWASLDDEFDRCDTKLIDAAYEPGDPKRSDFLDGED